MYTTVLFITTDMPRAAVKHKSTGFTGLSKTLHIKDDFYLPESKRTLIFVQNTSKTLTDNIPSSDINRTAVVGDNLHFTDATC